MLAVEVKPYYSVSAELTVQKGLLPRGNRMVIPRKHSSRKFTAVTKALQSAEREHDSLSGGQEYRHSWRTCTKLQGMPAKPAEQTTTSQPNSTASVAMAESRKRSLRVETVCVSPRRGLLLEVHRNRTTQQTIDKRGETCVCHVISAVDNVQESATALM